MKPLISTFGDKAPLKRTIYCWFNEFEFGRSSLIDKFREGRPSTAVVPANIDAVCKMIEMDQRVNLR